MSIAKDERRRLVVITGPSGAGKTTLVDMLRTQYPHVFSRCITHTTRDTRPHERVGIDYHFISPESMQAEIDVGNFVEWARVHDNLYGLHKNALLEATAYGVPLLIVDVQGARTISGVDGYDPLFVFIAPPTIEVLPTRLRARGDTTEEEIERRLKTAETELQAIAEPESIWHRTLINDTIDTCYAQLVWFLAEKDVLPRVN